MKNCNSCDQNLDLSCFHKKKGAKDGHTNSCKSCDYKKVKKWRLNNPEKTKALGRKHNKKRYDNNPDEIKAANIKFALNNPESFKAIRKRANNRYDRRNQPIRNYHENIRRTKKLNATPKWLSDNQLNEIKDIYINCPKGHHVDHIIPLQGKTVCGLHVPWNLQILTAEENIKKGNRGYSNC
jgi:hypothetical protein